MKVSSTPLLSSLYQPECWNALFSDRLQVGQVGDQSALQCADGRIAAPYALRHPGRAVLEGNRAGTSNFQRPPFCERDA
jgi:hypothetical protein